MVIGAYLYAKVCETQTCLLLLAVVLLMYVDSFSLQISVGFGGAPLWAVSAPDLDVGAWAWVQTRVKRRSPAARARARQGTSESVWVWLSRCCFSFGSVL